MTKAALLVLLTGCWSGGPPPPFVPQDAPTALQVQQRRVVEAVQLWYPVKIDAIIWRPCGTENSYYLTSARAVLLCTEMERDPLAGAFYAAHEAAHAVTWQLAGTLDEEAADEVGVLTLLRLGMTAELLGTAKRFYERHDPRHLRWDGHPSDLFRAWNIACLADGSFETGDPNCQALYVSTRDRWAMRLAAPQVDPLLRDPEPTTPVE